MNSGRSLFSQLMDFLPLQVFHECVDRYGGDSRVRTLTCYDQYLCMAFAQLTHRESLRDVVTCLRSRETILYHMGIRGKISRSTLADANERRDWRIFADFTATLIATARTLYRNDSFGADLEEMAFAIDSTMIELCLSAFPWAHFKGGAGAVKMHTALDLHGNLPTLIQITDGAVHDINFLDQIPIEPGAIYIMDCAYTAFDRLHRIHQAGAFFVTRARTNFTFRRQSSCRVDRSTGLRCDQTVLLKTFKVKRKYPDRIRRVKYFDHETGRRFVFLTNHFQITSLTVARLYKCRWQVELFFRWLKQHLRIKSFYGTTQNAVKTQIWIAISVYLLVAILKKRLNLSFSLYQILQILSVRSFEKVPLNEVLAENAFKVDNDDNHNQLMLFKI
jgi:hypothetical protein